MKRLFVFVSAIILALFLLNSFVLKDKEAGGKTAAGPANIVLRSTDGGQTWQDISKGLPENLRKEGVWSHGLVANDRGLYVRTGNALYHSDPNSTTSFWTKEIFPGDQREIAPGCIASTIFCHSG